MISYYKNKNKNIDDFKGHWVSLPKVNQFIGREECKIFMFFKTIIYLLRLLSDENKNLGWTCEPNQNNFMN